METEVVQQVALTISDWVIVFAVLLAPLLAVQVQKKLESFREDRERRLRVFKTLMATRAAVISADHVQALNMIDLEFHGSKFKKVTDEWKIYLDHLGSFPKGDENLQAVWGEKRIDLLAKLLMEMGRSLGYEFDVVHVKKGIYSPEAHAQFEDENTLIRRGLVRLLYGDSSLSMDVTSFPVSEEEISQQKAIRESIQNLLDGKLDLSVKIKEG